MISFNEIPYTVVTTVSHRPSLVLALVPELRVICEVDFMKMCTLRLTFDCGHHRESKHIYNLEGELANPDLWIDTKAYCDECSQIRVIKDIE